MNITILAHCTGLDGANLRMRNLIGGLREHRVEARVICPDKGDLIPALERLSAMAAVRPTRRHWRGLRTGPVR